ncbi:MAG: hypothetical protein ACOYI1_10305 [Caldicoprobacteraceae bacterium]|jgi:1,4-dihydroxy-2-naphthoate octaprenyltransferase
MNRITFSTSNCKKETISIPQDDDDLKNRQYTLPIYIGKERALFLFQSLYMAAYVDIFMMVALGMIPFTAFPVMLTIFPIGKNIRKFKKRQDKKDTFPLIIRNFLLLNVPMIFLIAAGILVY